jgi:hypothetical protein
VMARPNLSWRSKLLVLSLELLARVARVLAARELEKSQELKAVVERKQTGGTIPAVVSFPMRSLRSTGGASVSTSTLGKFSPRSLRSSLRTQRSKAFKPQSAPSRREERKELFPRRRGLGIPKGRGGRKPYFHIIGRREGKEDSRFWIGKRLLDRSFRERGHNLKSGCVRVQPIVG